MSETRDVVVLGGGISGLTVAWELKKAGVDVCLLEKSEQVGGCTRTERRDGFLLEKGPFNVIVRDPSFETLLDDVSDHCRVVSADPDARFRYVYRNGGLHAVPTNPLSMLTTKMLSPTARLRMLRGVVLSKRGGRDEETVEQVASRRVGREATDTLVSAAISGIFSGDISKLSLSACFPSVAKVDQNVRSLVGYGFRRAFSRKKRPAPRWGGMVSLDGGLGAMTQSLGAKLAGDCSTGARVRSLYHDPGGFTIVYDRDVEAHAMQARRVVLAVPVQEARHLLGSLLPKAATALLPIESASLAVLNLGYRRGDVGHPLRGFGFLVPRNEPVFGLMGVLWADRIFAHHAPSDQRLLRVFIGGARDPEAIKLSDDQLVERAQREIHDLLNVRGDPTLVDVVRYASAIPQYHLGHRKRVAELRREVKRLPGLFVVGNYLDGVSLNDCVRVAAMCAADVKTDVQRQVAPASCQMDVRFRAT